MEDSESEFLVCTQCNSNHALATAISQWSVKFRRFRRVVRRRENENRPPKTAANVPRRNLNRESNKHPPGRVRALPRRLGLFFERHDA